jgi:tetratricopeptide (TPR) repeat protein
VTVGSGFSSHDHEPNRRTMGRKNLPANAALIKTETAEMPSLGKLWPVWGVLVACVWIAFSPVLNNGFVDWDDKGWILENYSFRGLGWEQVRFAFTTFLGGLYQPLGWLVQSLTYEFSGLDPYGFHLSSLLFHVLNVVLLHLFCVRLLARTMPEVAARLGGALGWLCGVPVVLYAVHPLRVEPVAWATCQAYLPSVAFSLLAALAYLRAHPSSGVFRRSWMIGSSVLIVLAVLSKGSAVVLPFVFLILDVYPLRRLGPDGHRPSWPAVRKVLIEKCPVLVFCLAFMAVAFEAKRLRVEPEETPQPVLVARVAQASFAACFYLEKTAWPFGITAFYPRPEGGDFQTIPFAACVAGVALAVSAAFWLRRRWPWSLAALAAYLVIASPYLGLARVGRTLAADRYSYAPMMAWVVLGCAGLCRLVQRRWSQPVVLGAGAGALAVACGLMALCSSQCRVWDSSEHLWGQALEHARWSSELHCFMGATLADEGKLEAAIAEYREALCIRPDYFQATCDLGVALDRRGDTDAAVAYLREADRLRPSNARVHLNLGEALAHQGHLDEAVALYREGLRLQPNFPNLHFSLGVALLRQRKVDEAIEELTKAVELRPWYTEAYAILGGAFVLRGQQDEAVGLYRKALRLDPDHSAARINLGLALARQGRSAEAITQLREAIHRDRQNPEAHHVLGAILFSLGRVEQAATEFEETLRLRPDHAKARAFLALARGNRK